jgi:RNA polymerase-interacting CarD/CdnL/TRCF family regulator
MDADNKLTCTDHRHSLTLAALYRRLAAEELTDREKRLIQSEIDRLERDLGLA